MLWVVSRVSRWLLHWQIVMWCNVCAMFSCKPEIVHVCCCGSLIVGPKSQALNSHCGRFPRSYCRSRFQRLSSQSVQKQRDEWTPSTTCCLDEVDLYTIYSLMYVIVYIYTCDIWCIRTYFCCGASWASWHSAMLKSSSCPCVAGALRPLVHISVFFVLKILKRENQHIYVKLYAAAGQHNILVDPKHETI